MTDIFVTILMTILIPSVLTTIIWFLVNIFNADIEYEVKITKEEDNDF